MEIRQQSIAKEIRPAFQHRFQHVLQRRSREADCFSVPCNCARTLHTGSALEIACVSAPGMDSHEQKYCLDYNHALKSLPAFVNLDTRYHPLVV